MFFLKNLHFYQVCLAMWQLYWGKKWIAQIHHNFLLRLNRLLLGTHFSLNWNLHQKCSCNSSTFWLFLVTFDHRVSVRMIPETLGLPKSIVHEILTEQLQMRKFCFKLVSTRLGSWLNTASLRCHNHRTVQISHQRTIFYSLGLNPS